MLAGPSHRRRQMFPSNAPGAPRRAAQAHCMGRAGVRSGVKGRGGGASAERRGEMADKEKKKKESILDLSKYIDKTIRVKFQGGREASGILKGFDPLLNLVLDGTIEYMRDPDDQYKLTEDTRQLGLVVCRGTSVVLICPQDGMEAIPNPFIQQQEA
ncbi:LOW QUALITY PROTEIN: U6 snRNA-associated Sm-like protein LSm7 [Myotis myotis]|uniref:LOW QUALITY PROTEIN: U6 snRNA-associated Sm-like protein LSm7 n=1 Tax=Myotis myotis TaxID=51298 RepID=UPI001749BC55|nr:LOW QUALITY PROTEIN: U6 snRNA-associated Sm-like protein LSm7 [Myotis myotis]